MPREGGLILGIDGGQTGTRAALVAPSGAVVATSTGGSALSGDMLRECLTSVLVDVTHPGDLSVVAMGMTGADVLHEWYRETAAAITGCPEVIVEPDGYTMVLGAGSGDAAIAVNGGGGSVAYGLDAAGNRYQAGGWGYVLGDEGSAYSIGRCAINAALRGADGVGPATALTALICDRFGLPTIFDIKGSVFGGAIGFTDIARLSRLTAAAADRGDEAAAEILDRAGVELAKLAVAVGHKMPSTDRPLNVFAFGGVFEDTAHVFPAFTRQVLQGLPGMAVDRARLPPLAGAVLAGVRAAGGTVDASQLARLAGLWSLYQSDGD